MRTALVISMLALALITVQTLMADDLWEITAYCHCTICTGDGDGIMANGKKCEYGYVACNWMKFGTLVDIDGLGIFTVGDRGAKSLFGDKNNHIKHLDIYMPNHRLAKEFGVQYRKVTIVGGRCEGDEYVITSQHQIVRVNKNGGYSYGPK